jgi:two-component system phosphate regulon response regulator PhoB
MARRVLIVDDEADLSELLGYNLWKAGYETRVVNDGDAALKAIGEFAPDLVVLDIMMPGLNGHQVLTKIRGNPATATLPVIFLTAKNEESDEIEGLAKGADDFVTKPFSIRVLEARIQRLLNRRPPPEGESPMQIGGLALNKETHEATLDGKAMPLTVTEFRLLSSLLDADGKVLSRASLIKHAMGAGVTITERTIDVHITSIRKKLGSLAGIVKTVRGVGYRIDRDAAEQESNGHTEAGAAK